MARAVEPDYLAVDAVPLGRRGSSLQLLQQRQGVGADDDDGRIASRLQQLQSLGDGFGLSPHAGQSELAGSPRRK